MNIAEIKDLMAQFDGSSLREFSYKSQEDQLSFSKNEVSSQALASAPAAGPAPVAVVTETVEETVALSPVLDAEAASVAEGDVVDSPLVGVAYLAPAPDKDNFVAVGDAVKKGQTLLIIEAMKVMNEVPAPRDGVVTEILVADEQVVEFGQGLVRIK